MQSAARSPFSVNGKCYKQRYKQRYKRTEMLSLGHYLDRPLAHTSIVCLTGFATQGQSHACSARQNERIVRLSLKQLFPLVVSQVSDMWDCEIRYEAYRQPIGGIVALLDENGGEAIPHDPLGIAQ